MVGRISVASRHNMKEFKIIIIACHRKFMNGGGCEYVIAELKEEGS